MRLKKAERAKRKRALVFVCDDGDRSSLADMLREEGLERVDSAKSFIEASAILAFNPIDLLVIDFQVGVVPLKKALTSLEGCGMGVGTPVIVVAAPDNIRVAIAVVAAGGCLASKPLDMERIRIQVKRALGDLGGCAKPQCMANCVQPRRMSARGAAPVETVPEDFCLPVVSGGICDPELEHRALPPVITSDYAEVVLGRVLAHSGPSLARAWQEGKVQVKEALRVHPKSAPPILLGLAEAELAQEVVQWLGPDDKGADLDAFAEGVFKKTLGAICLMDPVPPYAKQLLAAIRVAPSASVKAFAEAVAKVVE